MKQGEIWLVKYPEGLGHEFLKERPALIIESDQQIKKTNIFTIMAITSNLNNSIDDDIFITRDNYNNLHIDSILKCNHIQGFDQSRFIKRIGKLKETVFAEVKDYLKIHFDL